MKVLFITHCLCLLAGAALVVLSPSKRRTVSPRFDTVDEARSVTQFAVRTGPSKTDGTTHASAQKSLPQERLDALRWFLKNNAVSVAPKTFAADVLLDRSIATVLDLTDAQFAALQGALTKAHSALVQNSINAAKVSTTPDENQLIVDIPPLAEGTDVFATMISSFKQTLDDKYAAFDEIYGESVQRKIDSLSTKHFTYTLTVKSYPSGQNYIEVKEAFVMPDGKGSTLSGTTQGQVSRDHIDRSMPILSRVVPAAFGRSKTN